ncbi:iron-containing alcohol dehydrogenase [uncultured Martelella sp.]|uniref:iron-containing alcohol dehydrogenase n=1 Tax=uncultured Martelella sp. TaxID=392331 RepID=UPI0029C8EE7F|nr:iron-containing alcohol dehydrogenase [uncultured Martelella sp.]
MTFFLCFPKINMSGSGCLADVPEQIAAHGFKKPLIVTDKVLVDIGLVAPLLEGLSKLGLEPVLFDGVVPNPPSPVVDAAYALFTQSGCDCIVGVGGGSPVDTAKAVRILTANPGPISLYEGVGKVAKEGAFLVAVNTTAGTAAEVTSNAVITDPERQVKMVIIDPKIIPDISVNDPEMMKGVPKATTAATGMDALTHAIEAYVAQGAHVLTDYSALEAIRLISSFLPRAVDDGNDLEAREMMAYGQFIAGLAFNSAGLGLVHAMAHQPGAVKDLPHGVCNAILMPVVEDFNRPYAVARFAKIATAMGVDTANMNEEHASKAAIQAIRDLAVRVGISDGFAALGVTEEDLEVFVDKALQDPCAPGNPVAANADQVLELYKMAM